VRIDFTSGSTFLLDEEELDDEELEVSILQKKGRE
jgi:hypothetical protein